MRRGILVLMALLALAATVLFWNRFQGVTAAEYETIESWLTCADCSDQQRTAIMGMGRRAGPLLTRALEAVPQEFLDNVASQYGSAWSRLDAPETDSLTFVRVFVDNFEATWFRRAALALGDLGMRAPLDQALLEHGQGLRGYRPDVAAVI